MIILRIESFIIAALGFIIAKGKYHMTLPQSIVIAIVMTIVLNVLFFIKYVGQIVSVILSIIWAYAGSYFIWNWFDQITWVRVVSFIVVFLFALAPHIAYLEEYQN